MQVKQYVSVIGDIVHVTISERNLKTLNRLWDLAVAGQAVPQLIRLTESNTTLWIQVEPDEVHYAHDERVNGITEGRMGIGPDDIPDPIDFDNVRIDPLSTPEHPDQELTDEVVELRFLAGATDPARPSTAEEENDLATEMCDQMLLKLTANRGKAHWRDTRCTVEYLLGRLKDEVIELQTSARINADDPDKVWGEAADVANFAAMIADRITQGAEGRMGIGPDDIPDPIDFDNVRIDPLSTPEHPDQELTDEERQEGIKDDYPEYHGEPQ